MEWATTTHSSSVLASTNVCAAFSPSSRTMFSHVCEIERSSCSSVLSFRWNVDSERRDGDKGVMTGVVGRGTGVDVGVDGPLNDARRLLMGI